MTRILTAFAVLLALVAVPRQASAACDPDAAQPSGSVYRICMPETAPYNGSLVIWAHGYQDAGTPIGIPENQLCFGGTCIVDLVNGLGFAFATNSYSKTGLAVLQGKDDIIDLVGRFTAAKGAPKKVYLVGASEGGLITALALEQRPDLFAAGFAVCGPIGGFRYQVAYLADARATFNYFFPGLIPGDPFRPDPAFVATWASYYETIVKPAVFDPANRRALNQWVKVANLPFDAADPLGSLQLTVADVLRYGVVNINDAAATLGGFPFDNRFRWYAGSDNDLLLNVFVPRARADQAALTAMDTLYTPTGRLQRPLVTMHTRRDQQVPYVHEDLYVLKTFASGSFLSRHVNLAVERYGHCNITADEALFGFGLMLLYDGSLQEILAASGQRALGGYAALGDWVN